MSKKGFRFISYSLGLVILAFGIILISKSRFGVTPVVSMAYTVSGIWNLNFGNTCFIMYIIIAVLEYLIKWKDFKLYDLLQIALSVIFTRCFNLFDVWLPEMEGMGLRLTCLFAGIVLSGIGAAMNIEARLVPNPGDGFVQVISDRTGKKLGVCKNCFDICCVFITFVTGMIFAGRPIGIGIGTLASMIGVGRVISVFHAICQRRAAVISKEQPVS